MVSTTAEDRAFRRCRFSSRPITLLCKYRIFSERQACPSSSMRSMPCWCSDTSSSVASLPSLCSARCVLRHPVTASTVKTSKPASEDYQKRTLRSSSSVIRTIATFG